MIKSLLLLVFTLLFAVSSADAASRFAVCSVTCTWDGSSTAMWSASSGGATGASVPGSADAVTLDAATCVGGVTCTITVNTTVTVQSITMGACTAATAGCILDFSANNNNVTLTAAAPAFSGSGTGTRTLNMGNGTWSITSSATAGSAVQPWVMTTTTNLTFNANSSVIAISTASAGPRTFAGGGLTYATLTIATNTSGGPTFFTGANTFSTLTVTGMNSLILPSVTQTITNAFNWVGTSSAPIGITVNSTVNTNVSATISIASGTATLAWATIRAVTFTGGATFTASNSLDAGANTGITITAPSVGGGRIIGGWLLDPANDNCPMFLRRVG